MENIMFVTASEKMSELAAEVSSDMGLNFPIIVGTVDESESIIKNNPNINVFIGRGRTAQSLQQFTDKPVVFLTCSFNDILEPVQRLSAYGINKIAVMASPTLIGEDSYVYKIENTEIYIQPYELEEQDKVALQLQREGIRGIVGSVTEINVAEKYNMKLEPLDTKASAIRRALTEAVKITKAQESEYLKEKEKAEEIHRYASNLYEAIEEAAAAVEELASSSEELAATSQETSNSAAKAFEDLNNTSDILEIIRRISKQINLLGLNAAIEASRAGEYGRGFSIVASEVRKLAKESNESASKINTMLNKFRNSVEFVTQNIEQSNVITQEQAKANQNIAHMLDSLRNVGHNLMNMAERNQ